MFVENFASYADGVPDEVRDAGPRVEESATPARGRRASANDAPED